MKTTHLVPALAAGMIAALAASTALAAAAETGDAARGKTLYTTFYCYSCHGTTGAGGGGAGPKLAPQPLPMAAFSRQLRTPMQRMPPYTDKVLTDAQVADIHAYLATIPRGKAVADIPILSR